MLDFLSSHTHRNGVRVRLVVGGEGRIHADLAAEIQHANPILDIRDTRLARLVRSGGADLDALNSYRVDPQPAPPYDRALRYTELVLTTPEPGPCGSIHIGRADARWSFTPAVEEGRRYLLEDQVEVTLNVQGRHAAQRVTAIFDRHSGDIVPGSILEHYLQSNLPLPA